MSVVLAAILAATGTVTGVVRGLGAAPENADAYVFVDDVKAPVPSSTVVEIALRSTVSETPMRVVIAGTTARWVNKDRIAHNVFSVTPGQELDLGTLAPDDEATHVFANPGVVSLYCNRHPREVVRLLVVPSALYAKVGTGGKYALAGVPIGKRTIKAWMPNAKLDATVVRVKKGVTNAELILHPTAPHLVDRWLIQKTAR